MKIRNRFTLSIAGTALAISIFFSVFVFIEMKEEIDKLVTRELRDMATAVIAAIEPINNIPFAREKVDYPIERFYIAVYNQDGTPLYQSPLAEKVDIPKKGKEGLFSVKKYVTPENIWMDPEDSEEYENVGEKKIKFSCLRIQTDIQGSPISLVIAKPLATLSLELQELSFELGLNIAALTILVFMISYFLAGKFLKPLDRINKKIRQIHESSLSTRIPLGKSKDELYTLSSELNTMFDRLQFSFEKQKEFLSDAAHEMRIPLTIVMLAQEELLAKDLPEDLREELLQQLNTLRRQGRLVKNLLDISHLEHKESIKHERVNVQELAVQVLQDFEEMLRASDIECSHDLVQLQVLGDRERLLRVFINLVENAIKYNHTEGGKIYIRVQKKDDHAEVSICNTGAAIPAKDIPFIFDQFYRVEKSRAQRFGGTGLGLTIVKKIIELHGGTITVESSDENTCFSFTLPLA